MRKITRALSLSFVFLAQTRHFSLTERNFVSGQARQSQSGMNNISTCRAILFRCHDDRLASHSIPSQELSRSLCLSNAPGTNVCRYEGKTGAASEKVPIEISLPCKGGQGILGGGLLLVGEYQILDKTRKDLNTSKTFKLVLAEHSTIRVLQQAKQKLKKT